MRRFTHALLVAAFLTVIALPLAVNLAGVDGADAEAENRTLAAWPTLDGTWTSAGQFGYKAAQWFEDHFGFRSMLIRWYGITRYFWLDVSPSPTVSRGQDGWLFYMEDGGLDDFTNEHLMTPGELVNWRKTIVRARDWCAARGIAYLFTVPPDKHTIYPDKFDPTIHQLSPMSRTDQLMTATLDTGAVLDVRQEIAAASRNERLFHVTDTHWNERGAYIAYRQIIDAARARVPGIPPPHDRSEFNATTRQLDGRDLAAMIGLKRVLHEDDLRLVPKAPRHYKVIEPAGGYATGGTGLIITEIPGSTLPRAVIFRDSFTSALAPFLSEHFSRAVYLWQNDFDSEVVEREHPDIVIQEIVGRHLYLFIPTPELIPAP
jgi:hypothetical protein